jgi:branched-chain amino acid transport system substrate-binding protein
MNLSLCVVFLLLAIAACARAQDPIVIVECPETDDGECVKVGFTYGATGSLQHEGELLRRGYELWAKHVASSGGIRPASTSSSTLPVYVELVAYDDGGSQQSAEELYALMNEDSSFSYLLGPFGSSYSTSALSGLKGSTRPIVLSNAASDSVYAAASAAGLCARGVVTPASRFCDAAIEDLVNDGGARTFALVSSTNGFASAVASGCVASVESRLPASGALLARYEFDSTPSDAQVQAIRDQMVQDGADNADVLLAIGLLADGKVLLDTLRPLEFDGIYMTSSSTSPDFIDDNEALAQGVLGSAQWDDRLSVGTEYSDNVFGSPTDYAELYEREFDDNDVSWIAAASSAAGLALQRAIEAATDHRSQADVCAALSALDIDSFFGPIEFAAVGYNERKPSVITQVHRRDLEIISPDDQDTSSLRYPIDYASSSSLSLSIAFALTIALFVLA